MTTPPPVSPKTKTLLRGQTVAAFGRHYDVELASGGSLSCVRRSKRTDVACGDEVDIAVTSPGQGVIEDLLPRRTLLYRRDAFREKLIAANVTLAAVVVAAVPTYREELLNRCLVAIEAAGIEPLIILNKADMEETEAAAKALQLYQRIGYQLIQLAAKQDVTPLLSYLAGQTSILVGQSGMGKSTLVNALVPTAAARVGEISEALDAGRHTTTASRLYHLNANSHLIDSPGMQEFGVYHLNDTDIAAAMPEFRSQLGHCRFNNCRHLQEPGCAIEQAMQAGKISVRRLEFYRQLIAQHDRFRVQDPARKHAPV